MCAAQRGFRRTLTRQAFGLALWSALAATGAVAQTFPAKPVRLVVPFAASGAVDAVARIVSPVVAAATAIAGHFCTPDDLGIDVAAAREA